MYIHNIVTIVNKKSRIYGTSDQSVSYDLSDLSDSRFKIQIERVRSVRESDL